MSPRGNRAVASIRSRHREPSFSLGDTKTGYSVRPIGLAAIKALGQATERVQNEFVLPAIRGTGHFQSVDKAWRSIAGRRLPDVTPHVLRHSFASTAEDIGLTVPTIAALLGYSVSSSATLGYIHKVDAALISAANQVSDRVAAGMRIGEKMSSGEFAR
jgi:integrase